MQVAQFVRLETTIGANAGQYLARFKPILLRGSQDSVVSRQ
jgi:hypothetical protein